MSKHICILGGRGFVGTPITETLRERGHEVITMDPGIGGDNHRSIGILDEHLNEHLDGFDVVVNLVGLSPMKKPGIPGYHDLQVAGAENVVGACEANSVERLVHMSALGADPNSDITFLKTKGLGEQAVKESSLDSTIFRPSLIFDHDNELITYARKFAPTRTFPNIPVGLQPIYRRDVATLFADAAESNIEKDLLEIGGPDQMTMFEFVKKVYNARGYACKPLPVLPLMKIGLHLMDPIPLAPFGSDQAKFLGFDNITEQNDATDLIELTVFDDWLAQEF